MTSDPAKILDSEGEELSLNRVDKALQTVGITIHDTNGQFKAFDETMKELASVWDTLDSSSQRYYKVAQYLNPLNCWDTLRAVLTTT